MRLLSRRYLKDYSVESGRDGEWPETADYIRILFTRYDDDQEYTARINNKLIQMSPAEQARARSFLTRLRTEVHGELAGEFFSEPQQLAPLRALDEMLSRLYAVAARRIPNAIELGDLTVTPLDSQERQLREALIPAVVQTAHKDARRTGFTDRLPGQDQAFRDRLRQALLEQISEDEKLLVHGKGPAERAKPENMYTGEHIQEIADLVLEWIRAVFPFAHLPQRIVVGTRPEDQGAIYDAYTYYEWLWRSWTPAALRTNARVGYFVYLFSSRPETATAKVVADHSATVVFDFDSPHNEETRIADEVMDELLGDDKIVRRIAEIGRNWSGEARLNKILISFFREAGKDVEKLWKDIAYTLIHEIMHYLEHPDYGKHARSFHGDASSQEFHTLVEGGATLLAEMVWADVMSRLTETGEGGRTNLENWNEIILGPHYFGTDLSQAPQELRNLVRARYNSEAEAIRLVSLVGIENLLAAFFGGQTWKIAGAVRGTRGSMLAAHDVGEQPRQPSRSPSSAPSTSSDESSDDDGPRRDFDAPVGQRISRLQPEDLPQTASLDNRLFPGEARTESDIEEYIRRGDLYLGAYDGDGALIGYAGLDITGLRHGRQAKIATVGVDPDWQGRGTGTALLRALLAIVDEADLPVSLHVRTDNERAIALYLQHGFTQTGLEPGYYPTGGDAYVMLRPAPVPLTRSPSPKQPARSPAIPPGPATTDGDAQVGDTGAPLPGPVRPSLPPSLPPPVAEPLVAELESGWEWLDEARGIAIPADPALTGGVRTNPTDWRAAQPGPGRGYAVHEPTGRIAAPIQTGDGLRQSLHEITNGWVHDGGDLVHQDTGAVLRGQGVIGVAGEPRVRDVRQRAQSRNPAVRARQLNREDLMRWLLERGALAGPVPGVAVGAGWQTLTEPGATRWEWNGPGPALRLPRVLSQGHADGRGMRCLLDSLRQLMRPLLPQEQRGEMTVDFLRGWLDEHLPLGNEARAQLLAQDQVDVWSVLPVFTTMFQVRVQVFEQTAQGILPSHLEGPAADQDGNPTPVLRLHWTGNEALGHFTPVFEPAGPVSELPARRPLGAGPSAVAEAWQARRDFRLTLDDIHLLLRDLDAPGAAADIAEQAGQIEAEGGRIAVNVTAQSAGAETDLLRDLAGLAENYARRPGGDDRRRLLGERPGWPAVSGDSKSVGTAAQQAPPYPARPGGAGHQAARQCARRIRPSDRRLPGHESAPERHVAAGSQGTTGRCPVRGQRTG